MPERKPSAPSSTAEVSPDAHDPYAAFRFRGFAFYTLGNAIAIAGRQMLTIAIEWEVYARTHSATALGLVGLVAAIPIVGLSLPAGHLADRFRRKTIILISQATSALCSICLALISWQHLSIPRFSVLLWANDCLRSIATVFERHAGYHFDDLSLPLIYLLLLDLGFDPHLWLGSTLRFSSDPRAPGKIRQRRHLEQQHLSNQRGGRTGGRRISHR